MTIDLTDKTAVVTGGSSGIGQAFASTLTASGAKVGITGRDPERLREAAARCGAAWSLAGNLANLGDRQALVAKVYSTWPRLDLLINNAGIMLQPNLLDGGESLGRLEEEIPHQLSRADRPFGETAAAVEGEQCRRRRHGLLRIRPRPGRSGTDLLGEQGRTALVHQELSADRRERRSACPRGVATAGGYSCNIRDLRKA
jgi:short chain dehydrogenase